MSQIVICALYKFVRLEDFTELKNPILKKMQSLEIRGTLLLADEGINGTVSGSRIAIDELLAYLNADKRLNGIVHKESFTDQSPFHRTKVKLKKEIVTMGIQGIDPLKVVGTYVKPEDWNDLISDPDVLLIDTRNDYEYQVGTFKNAVNPNTDSFREFPDYVNDNLNKDIHQKVAMFCTGGIRCEKSTAYLKEQGFDNVYHLQGGILKYLEQLIFLRSDSHQMFDLFHMSEASRFETAYDTVDKAASLLYYVWISGVMKKPSVPTHHPENLSVKLFAIVYDRIERSRRHCPNQLKAIALTLHNPLLPQIV